MEEPLAKQCKRAIEVDDNNSTGSTKPKETNNVPEPTSKWIKNENVDVQKVEGDIENIVKEIIPVQMQVDGSTSVKVSIDSPSKNEEREVKRDIENVIRETFLENPAEAIRALKIQKSKQNKADHQYQFHCAPIARAISLNISECPLSPMGESKYS